MRLLHAWSVCSALGMIDELERGVPSVVSEDLGVESAPLTRDELRERMSGNLCRCSAYNGIADAIESTFAGVHAMMPFDYMHAGTVADAIKSWPAPTPARSISAAAPNLVDLMREDHRKSRIRSSM